MIDVSRYSTHPIWNDRLPSLFPSKLDHGGGGSHPPYISQEIQAVSRCWSQSCKIRISNPMERFGIYNGSTSTQVMLERTSAADSESAVRADSRAREASIGPCTVKQRQERPDGGKPGRPTCPFAVRPQNPQNPPMRSPDCPTVICEGKVDPHSRDAHYPHPVNMSLKGLVASTIDYQLQPPFARTMQMMLFTERHE